MKKSIFYVLVVLMALSLTLGAVSAEDAAADVAAADDGAAVDVAPAADGNAAGGMPAGVFCFVCGCHCRRRRSYFPAGLFYYRHACPYGYCV